MNYFLNRKMRFNHRSKTPNAISGVPTFILLLIFKRYSILNHFIKFWGVQLVRSRFIIAHYSWSTLFKQRWCVPRDGSSSGDWQHGTPPIVVMDQREAEEIEWLAQQNSIFIIYNKWCYRHYTRLQTMYRSRFLKLWSCTSWPIHIKLNVGNVFHIHVNDQTFYHWQTFHNFPLAFM